MKKHKHKNLKMKKENEEKSSISEIKVGDIILSSKGTLRNPVRTLSRLLSNRRIKNYLSSFERKRILQGASYVG